MDERGTARARAVTEIPPDVLAALAAAVGTGGPDADLRRRIEELRPALVDVALPTGPDGHPYSRLVLHSGADVEVMVARWRPDVSCAPHDHGGSSGFVTALEGRFSERRYRWSGDDLVVAARLDHPTGDAFGFGASVVHDMAAGAEGGVTLHVYAPAPQHMRVYDLDAKRVLDLWGDHGAWLPEGEHPEVSFAQAAAVAAAASAPVGHADQRPVIWVAFTTHYRGGSEEFAVAARTMARELGAAHPEAEVQLAPLQRKHDFVAEMARLAAEGRVLAQLHFVGHSGMYGIMFGSVEWPEQFSPHEWRALHIPFAPDGEAFFHACRTARWFAPFFARTFGVPTSGNHGYTTVSTRKDRFAWAGFRPTEHDDLYLIATPGKKAHGIVGSVRKYLGAPVEPMTRVLPSTADPSYDKVAELYDRAYVDIRVREAEWAWILERVAAVRRELGRPLRIVEVGCGNGALLRELDRRGDLASGVGFDDSEEMVGRARARSGGDHPRLRFERIQGPSIDLPDDAVDVVLSFLSFRYLDWDPIMAEARRVLAAGGHLWVVDMVERPVRLRELPLLVRSTLHHLQVPKRHPAFAKDVAALTSHPDWKAMVGQNPIRAEHEYRWFLESRFPGRHLEVLTVTMHQRVVAFDSGPLPKGAHAPLSYP
jgi:SAM-dependent methyltransferase